MRTATTSAMVMPCCPPKISPIPNSSKVRAVRRNVVLMAFIFYSLRRSGGACLRFLACKFHLLALGVCIHHHFVAGANFVIENLERQRILNQPLYGSLHGTRAVFGIVAFAEQQLSRRGSQFESDLASSEQFHDLAHLKFDN